MKDKTLEDVSKYQKHKMIIIGALGYFILLIDLIPDFIPVASFTDNVALLVYLKTVSDNVTPKVKGMANAGVVW